MFNKSDSLFSEHFYEFCIEMIKDEDHMSSGKMMSHSGMMEGDMEMMGSNKDMDEMAELMESYHNGQSSLMRVDYYEADSLMFVRMSECEMMNEGTGGIEAVFNKMQRLRIEHRSMHGNY